MSEIINIQKCLILCDYWRFIDTLNKQLHFHEKLQIAKIKEYADFKYNTIFISKYKNIPEEIQGKIYSF